MFLLNEVPFHRVQVTDPFWSRRQQVNHERSLPKQYDMCKKTGRLEALRLEEGSPRHPFWDSDVAKWLEAACQACRIRPDAALEGKIEHVAELFRKAQQADGYLHSYFSVRDKERRWKNLRYGHELYTAGHIIEAAVAHHGLTGKDDLLATACRLADYIDSVFGRSEGKIPGYCGHEEIELALVRLYRATTNRRYLELATYFVDERGRKPSYFEREREGTRGEHYLLDAPLSYFQAHAPVREQREATGHAVRAMYLYCAMADLAAENGDESLRSACERLWADVTGGKMYLTGGVGNYWEQEAFSEPYFLPNERAYCETCAAVGLAFWSQRMLRLTGARAYAEVLECCLHNATISGMSLDGESFFYMNPLASTGGHHRQQWFECSCCPSNLSRLLATLGGCIYSETEEELRVNLYIGSEAEFRHGIIRQSGGMPWEGRIRLEFQLAAEAEFAFLPRIPAWSGGFELKVNGTPFAAECNDGWARVRRRWKNGDAVDLSLPMDIKRTYSDPRVFGNAGQVALRRGPFVYCIEDADFGASVLDVRLRRDAELNGRLEDAGFGEKVFVIEGTAARHAGAGGGELYFADADFRETAIPFRAIPYFAWDNRSPGAMRVWIPEG